MKDFDLLRTPADGAKWMSKREHRRFTAEQKLEILKEADEPGVTVCEVCRRNAGATHWRYRYFIAGGR